MKEGKIMYNVHFRLKTLWKFKNAVDTTLQIYGLSATTRKELQLKAVQIEKAIANEKAIAELVKQQLKKRKII